MSEMLAYLMGSVAYSLAGFLVGWLSCSLYSRTSEMVEGQQFQSAPAPERSHKPPVKTFPRAVVFGVVLVVLALGTVGSYVKQSTDRSCQTDFNTRLAVVTVKRATYADEDRRALVNFLETVHASNPSNLATTDEALSDLLATYNQTGKKRDANPLPSLTEACGK